MSTFVQYEGDATTAERQVPFSFIERTHVKVFVNGFPQVDSINYSWLNDATIKFLPGSIPGIGTAIELRRDTPLTALVTYQNSAVLTAIDLNVATKQALYGIEEVRDRYEARLEAGLSRLNNGDVTNADEMIDAVIAAALDSQLALTLQERISDIDAAAEAIMHYAPMVNDHDVKIVREEFARQEGDTFIAQTLLLLGARSDDNSAFLLDLDTVKVSPTESLATRLATLEASTGDASALVEAEATARADADSALASDITTLSTTVGDNTSSIETNATSIDGLSAQYTVKVDVNGRVAGYGLAIDATTSTPVSEFTVLADKFSIVEAGTGKTPKVPFLVTSGTVFMQNVVIGGALIEDLSIGTLKIAAGSITGTAVTVEPADGNISYSVATQPALENAGINGHATYTAPSGINTQVTVSFSAQGNASGTTSGTAVGHADLQVLVQINGTTVWTRTLGLDGYITTNQFGVFAGTKTFAVTAGSTIDVYLTAGRTFSSSGSSPAQTLTWKQAILNLLPTLR